ncbi:hypothetical protein HPB51_013477 [Rhipicephalus microplus]|uniref:mRNA (guanine-N(7))-methyltransferase n=1 Tax=Rhipicephalus microplus TaxID=6941 RepID=A0A9J6E0R8_RHIMP|nr:hypothetical protein HPB51_013477 [Rhipicephalus microplus]
MLTRILLDDINIAAYLHRANERFRELEERHRRRAPGGTLDAEIIEAYCTILRIKNRHKYKDIALVLVGFHLRFRYSFESLPQSQCILCNAAECLVSGGFFIINTPDANDHVRCVREVPHLKFGDDEFHIEFHGSKHDLPLFLEQYNFHLKGVVHCPKFLENFDILEEKAKDFDLRLVL